MRLLQLELTAAAAAMMLLVGCADTHPAAQHNPSTAALPGTPGCFLRSDFRGDWQVLNNTNLIVYAPPLPSRNPYLIRLALPVVGLNFNTRLGLQSVTTSSRICGNLNAYLLVPGNTPARVLITAVQELSPAERDRLLAEAGQPARRHVASSSLAQP
jgi:Family of unknown function (DUF6491)